VARCLAIHRVLAVDLEGLALVVQKFICDTCTSGCFSPNSTFYVDVIVSHSSALQVYFFLKSMRKNIDLVR
jgi:hypothetical protein